MPVIGRSFPARPIIGRTPLVAGFTPPPTINAEVAAGTGTAYDATVSTSGVPQPTIRQTVVGTATTTSNSYQFPGAPVSGNALVVCFSGDKDPGTLGIGPGTWTVEHNLHATSTTDFMAWKVSDGTEGTAGNPIVLTQVIPGSGGVIWVAELAETGTGAWTMVGKASNPNPVDTTTATAWATGTTAATTGDGLAIASVTADTVQSGETGATWTNGYTHAYNNTGTGTGLALLLVATKFELAGATSSTTATRTGTPTVDQMSGAVIVLGRAATGGTNASAEVASGTGAASDAQAVVAPNADLAAGTGTAADPSAQVQANAEAATATGAAGDATVSTSTSTSAPAETAAATGTAGDAATAITVNAGTAAGTGTALDATVSTATATNAAAEAAVGSGAAFDASVSVGAQAGTPTAAGTAPDPTVATVAGTVVHLFGGGSTTDGFVVTPKTANTTSARLKVSTTSDLLTAPVFFGPVSPDAQGYARLVATGLTAGTLYYYRVESNGTLVGATGQARTAPSAAASFTFAVGSCSLDDVAPAAPGSWARAQARNPDLLVVTGDFPYIDIGTNDPAGIRADREALLATTGVQSFVSQVATYYIWSDHDYGANNADSTSASKSASQTVYRQQVPYPGTLPATDSINQTFTWGRVRFICTDERSYKSPVGNTDNSSKTMLGTTQKQWLKDQITAATEAVLFWVGDTPWTGTTPDDDEWANYTTERTELGAFFAASGKRIIRIAGDMHALAADNGTGSVGGIPVFQAAPWRNNASIKGEPYSQGIFPASGTTMVEQYGIVAVTDTGTSITVAFTGYDSSDVARITLTVATGFADAAAGTGTAGDAATASAANAGAAAGTGTAFDATVSTVSAVNAPAEAAQGTGTASDAQASVGAPAGTAAATGAAFDTAVAIAATAEVSAGTGLALDAGAASEAQAGTAAGTGQAADAAPSVAVNAEAPTGAGVAFDASVSTSTSATVNAEAAAGTGTALDAAASVAAGAGVAAGTGVAFDATVSTAIITNAPAEVAAGSGTAFDATVAIVFTAGVAAGTGAADNALAGVGPTPAAAASTGTAFDPSTAIVFTAGVAAATGAALNAVASYDLAVVLVGEPAVTGDEARPTVTGDRVPVEVT